MSNIIVPQCRSYQGNLVAVRANVLTPPVEGNKLVNISIAWGTDASPQGGVSINLQNAATLAFSQIAALSVDNSACGSDIHFVFPDTGETTTIPAYAPKVIVEVFTNQQQFYVIAPNFRTEDVTNFSVLNFLPPPVAIPTTVEQQTIAANNITADGATSPLLIPNNVDGTLLGISVSVAGPVVIAGGNSWNIVDGNGKLLFAGTFHATLAQELNATLLSLSVIHTRFQKGIQFVQSGGNIGGTYSVNLLYRTP